MRPSSALLMLALGSMAPALPGRSMQAQGAAQQGRVAVMNARSPDSLSARVAAAVRSELPAHLKGGQAVLVDSLGIAAALAAGAEQPLSADGWLGVRALARLLDAEAVIDVYALAMSGTVQVALARMQVNQVQPDIFPMIVATSLERVVELVIERLASDTALLGASAEAVRPPHRER